MTINSTVSTVLRKATDTRPSGKPATGHLPGAKSAPGFAGMMSTLAAQDPADAAVADPVKAKPGLENSDEKLPVALDVQQFSDSNFIADMVLQSAGLPAATSVAIAAAALPPQSALAKPLASGGALPAALALGTQQQALPVDVAQGGDVASSALMSASRASADPASAVSTPAAGTAKKGAAVPVAVADVQLIPAALTAWAAPRETLSPTPVALATALLETTALLKPAGQGGKLKSAATPGAADALGVTAGVFDRLGLSSSYTVAQTSVVVADTQVAETVSYWVTHGVQNAELTLDGLGSEPVKVHISVDGDRARVDFRSDQVGLRQALESAAGQLKSLLSSEGLQLSGMSVGGFGSDRGPGDERQRKPEPARSALVTALPTVGVTSRHLSSPPAGQALDLYV